MTPSFWTWLSLLILPAAFLLDRFVGDPRWLPHPIRWMGCAIQFSEPFFRRHIKGQQRAGALFAVSLIGGCWVAATLVLAGFRWIHPLAGLALEMVMLFYCFSVKSLAQAAREIYHSLSNGQVDTARGQVAMIVGRDVADYQTDDIARATVETVAENFVDGFLSPLFFAVIGGGPLALAYKMINTLDSMVGYKNDRYLFFGKTAARIDDVANYLPARLSVYMIAMAAQLTELKSGRRTLHVGRGEGRNHSSPNAGFPEAAFAGALGVRLNGPNYYGGVLVEKPYIGGAFAPPTVAHIDEACRLLLRAAEVGVLCGWSVAVLRMLLSFQ